MKKSILIFIGVLFGIYLLVSIIDFKSEYNAEVYLFKANKLLSQILQNPLSIPARFFERTVNAYKKVIAKFPNSASAKRAVLSVGQVYIINNKFEQARQELRQYELVYKDNKDMLSDIQFLIGNAYEKEGKWSTAQGIYNSILEKYPDSLIAMQIPIYIGRYFLKNGKTEDAALAYQQAAVYYQKMARQNPDSEKGYMALSSVVTCYVDQRLWPEAVDTLTNLVNEYPKSRELPKLFQIISLLCLEQLKNPQKAIEIYEEFIQKHPKNYMVKTLRVAIEKLKKGEVKK